MYKIEQSVTAIGGVRGLVERYMYGSEVYPH